MLLLRRISNWQLGRSLTLTTRKLFIHKFMAMENIICKGGKTSIKDDFILKYGIALEKNEAEGNIDIVVIANGTQTGFIC